MDPDQNLEILIKELASYVDTMEENVIALEKDEDDQDSKEEISRMLHSCKGILGFSGPAISSVVNLLHQFEDRILEYSKSEEDAKKELISDLFQLVDGLRMLSKILDDDPTSSQILNCFGDLITTPVKIKLETEYRIIIFLSQNMKMKSTRALSFLNVLKRKSTIGSVNPSTEMLYDNFEDFDQLEITLTTKEELDIIRELVKKFPEIETYQITEIKHEEKTTGPTEIKGGPVAYSYSMDHSEISKISNILEEFLRIEKLLQKLELKSLEKYEKKLVSSFKRKILEIQESINLAQKVPLSTAFNQLQRVVRDVAKKHDKNVQLFISGEHLTLDKSIVEKFTDPLIVLLQNAVIHGVESDDERKQKNKSTPAIVRVEAIQDAGNTIIRVFDNGRGIDYEQVWDKGVELDLVDDEEFSEERAKQLLFESSFSTVEEVSTEAGRGIGLYSVKKFVLDVNGKINVTSKKGENTVFELVFPVQNNISSVILVDLNNTKFGFPETHVQKIFRTNEGTIIRNGALNAFKFKVQEDEIRTINLPAAFNSENNQSTEGAVLLWDNGLDRVGFYVDEILTFEEMAINYLDPVAEISPLFAGTASLGSGDIVFLLQPHEFLNN